VEYLSRNGYLTACGNVASAAAIGYDEIDDEQEECGLKMDDVGKKMDDVVKKLDELIDICRNVLDAILFLAVVMVYSAAVAK
jgi:hypothetical protein